MKGYMVSSVNEWGADQTRILLISDESIHRVKYNFAKEEVCSLPLTLDHRFQPNIAQHEKEYPIAAQLDSVP